LRCSWLPAAACVAVEPGVQLRPWSAAIAYVAEVGGEARAVARGEVEAAALPVEARGGEDVEAVHLGPDADLAEIPDQLVDQALAQPVGLHHHGSGQRFRGRVKSGAQEERDREVSEARIGRGWSDDPHLVAALQDVGQDREHALIACVAEGERARWFTVDLDGEFGLGSSKTATAGDADLVVTPSWAAV
jgi:hypothetical protein